MSRNFTGIQFGPRAGKETEMRSEKLLQEISDKGGTLNVPLWQHSALSVLEAAGLVHVGSVTRHGNQMARLTPAGEQRAEFLDGQNVSVEDVRRAAERAFRRTTRY